MKIYQYESPKLGAVLVLVYKWGLLYSYELHYRYKLKPHQVEALKARLPFYEEELYDCMYKLGFQPQAQKPKVQTQKEKIALFCQRYKEATEGLTYKVSKQEVGMIRGVEVNRELLDAFFESNEWWADPKTIERYVRYFNKVQEVAYDRSAAPAQKRWPDAYDAKLARRLEPQELEAYYAHLRELGLRPVKAADGRILDFKPPNAT
jgi:hypothetical protein